MQPPAQISQIDITLGNAAGMTLRGARTTGPGRVKAVAVLAHGYAEHIGRYEHVITPLAANRFAVYAIDHRGHGRSDGERAHIARFDDYVDDLDLVVQQARAEFPGLPCYLIGHSMGGLIALRYALAHPESIDALALIAPGMIPMQATSPAVERAGRLIAKFAPKLPLVPGLGDLLSSDPEVMVRAGRDPQMYQGRTRAGFAIQLLDAGRDAMAKAHTLQMPVLIQQGDADQIVNPEGAAELYRRIGVRPGLDNSLITWPGMQHELLNEPDGDQVLGVLIGWLNGHYVEWRKIRDASASA